MTGLPIHKFDGKLIECCESGRKVTPDWNPYDGIWECWLCGEDVSDIINTSPSEATFAYTNQNPDL